MKKKRVTLYLEESLWLDFRAACIKRSHSASELVNIMIQEQMTSWMMEDMVGPTVGSEPTKDGENIPNVRDTA